MEQLAKMINQLPSLTRALKIKTCLSNIFIYRPVRDRLLEEEEEDESKVSENGEKWSEGHGNRKSPFHADNIIGPLAPAVIFYQILSTFCHSMNIIISLALIYYSQSRVLKDNSGHIPDILCHMPRVFVHPILGPEYMNRLGGTFSFLLLGWRGWMLIKQRRLKLDTITYLLLDNQVIRKNLNPQQALKSYTSERRFDLAQRVMFYKVEAESYSDVAIGLRPNRTPEARERLLGILHNSFRICTITFLLFNITFITLNLWTASYRIDIFYTDCELSNSLLVTANRTICSIILSTISFLDGFGAYLYSFPLDFIFIEDLKIYWAKIELELNELYRLVLRHRYLCDQLMTKEVDDHKVGRYSLGHRVSINALKVFNQSHLISSQQPIEKEHLSVEISEIGSLSYLTDRNGTFELGKRIYVFQMAIGDFFKKLNEINEYMSLKLGITFLIWLATNGIVSYLGLRLDTSATSLVIRLIQLTMLVIFCIISLIVLNLKSSIDPAYKTVTSIMAHDPSIDKIRWLPLLQYYTVRPRHSFRIFYRSVFTLLIFLQSFSYTLTFAIYMFSLKGQS